MTDNQEDIKAISFKILIHDVQLQSKERIMLQSPQISVSLGSFPRLIIKAQHSISTMPQKTKAFRHGKSALIQITIGKMKEILSREPLELLLMNDSKILGGSRINLKAFVDDIDYHIDKQYKFRRGTFHLLDSLGQPYALTDVSICLHPQISSHPTQREQLISQMPSQLSNSSFQDPMPDQITYQKNFNQQKNSSRILNKNPAPQTQKQQTHIFVQENNDQKQRRGPQSAKNQSFNAQTFGIKQKPMKQVREDQTDRGLKQASAPPDISIMDWVNGHHCPPPLILDKKIYYHDVQEDPYQPPRQGQNQNFAPASLPQKISIGLQTEGLFIPMIEPRYYNSTSQLLQNFDEQRVKTNQSDEYMDDFESIGHSQLVVSNNNLKKNLSSASINSQISQGFASPKTNYLSKRQKSVTVQNTEIDEQISEIYSDDFDSMSQAASMKRSLSLERLNSKRQSYIQQDEISESYVQDFESMSQSTSQVRKKR